MDPLMLLFLLIAGLTGADSVSTVSWVSAWRGGSVSIPCFYEDRYKTHMKYWCRGKDWKSCTPIVHTDSPQEGKVSIRDDPDQQVFTVTIKNLTARDSSYFWCGVKISGGSVVGDQVTLSVTDGVSTVKWVSVQRGGSVTIPCFYEDRYKTHVKYWCRGYDVRSCTPIVHTDSPQEGKVSVRDDPDQRVFTVTINNLTAEDSDIYWCRIKISEASDPGDQVSLSVTFGSQRLSVDKLEVTGVEGDSVSVQCRYENRDSLKLWCKIGGSCVSERSVSLDGRPVQIMDDRVNGVFSVTVRRLERKDTGWYWCDAGGLQIPVHITVNPISMTESPWSSLFLYVGLGSLVLLLIIIIIITWKVRDKHKKKMAKRQNPGRTELTLNPNHEYTVIDRSDIIEGAPPGQASEEPGADVTYSSIVLQDPEQVSSRCSSHHPAVTPASDVVYSSVALKHRE
ncbi:polymeric immunoglobulin receptor-like isoform X20 [Brienomyrus brachyistius]|uniref:polymeric immunoglobulin receptor-like isoform X20 n=1 Tax=Brienomyrus brachyistius TaxID=42636 RepID=UPI0020B42B5D|nr:polymeric immunoglobulin receptor-like isoform X20 [Brienomyrus brachyistius]XP_048868463.1 polymeric immunoglobulin receptor-like isoform X20 [Brienomyrus brachyistius]